MMTGGQLPDADISKYQLRSESVDRSSPIRLVDH